MAASVVKGLLGGVCLMSLGCTHIFFPLEEWAFDAEVAEPDALIVDASPPLPDAAQPDAAILPDAALPDAALPDAALPDAAPAPDAALPDAAPAPDAALPDAAPAPDAGPAFDFCQCCGTAITAFECVGTPLAGDSFDREAGLLGCACGDELNPGPCAASCAFCTDQGGLLDVECEDCVQTECPGVFNDCLEDPACVEP